MGLFIVFEGIEGCGKTTQIELLGRYLAGKKLPIVITREPGGTPVSEEIRKIFLHSVNRDILPLTELLLVTAARVQHVDQLIRPALHDDKIVVCDRFCDATVAYQGYGEGIPLALIFKSQELFLDYLRPDITMLFDCPVEVGLSRSRSRNKAEGLELAEGRFEEKTVQFHEKVRGGYLDLAKREPERFTIVDAQQSIEAIHEQVCLAIDAKLKEKGYAV